MYQIDNQDRLVQLESIPACSVGAPLPSIIATEHYTALCYLVAQPPPDDWRGQYATLVDHRNDDRIVAVVEFRICADVRFGWFPDENTCPRHPLARVGLDAYSAYEVLNSSWVRKLAELESGNRDKSLRTKRHFVFTFHDTTVECVADSFDIRVQRGSIHSALAELVAGLGDDG